MSYAQYYMWQFADDFSFVSKARILIINMGPVRRENNMGQGFLRFSF